MHGNRDFLVGDGSCGACRHDAAARPDRAGLPGERWLLTHGDALCLADTDYMRFRAQVRKPAWQREFLAQPLAERRAHRREALRDDSEQRKRQAGDAWADVDAAAHASLAGAAERARPDPRPHARPAEHMLDARPRRIVLSDWDWRGSHRAPRCCASTQPACAELSPTAAGTTGA